MTTAAALVLTGGASRRFGRHKPSLPWAGHTVVAQVLQAVGSREVVVVGSSEGVPAGVRVVTEKPPGGGPASAIAEGLKHLGTAELVVLLAADLPLLTPTHLDQLEAALGDADGACFVDDAGRAQWLCSAWRTEALHRELAAAPPSGRSLRSVLSPLSWQPLTDPSRAAFTDIDTPADFAALRTDNAPRDDHGE